MNVEMFRTMVFQTATVVMIIGCVMGLFFYKSFKDPMYKTLTLYLCFAVFSDITYLITNYFWPLDGVNNITRFLFSRILEFSIFAYFFITYFKDHWGLRLLIAISYLFFIFDIYSLLSKTKNFLSFASFVGDISVSFMALFYLFSILSKGEKVNKYYVLTAVTIFMHTCLISIYKLTESYMYYYGSNNQAQTIIDLGFALIYLLFYSSLAFIIWKNGKIQMRS